MKKVAGIIILSLGAVLLVLNLSQSNVELPTLSLNPINIEQTSSIKKAAKNESVKIILPSVFNFMSNLLRKH